MNFLYIFIPIISWFIAGSLKFIINYLRFGKKAIVLIGNGGFPSTHTTIISSITMFVGFTEGFGTPTFGLGMAVLMITVIDATGIRRTVGKHAEIINKSVLNNTILRERQGHSKIEVLGGFGLGVIIAFIGSLL